jgi:hypothetical protein
MTKPIAGTTWHEGGWTDQPHVFGDEDELGAKMDFLKERVGIEVGFGHARSSNAPG